MGKLDISLVPKGINGSFQAGFLGLTPTYLRGLIRITSPTLDKPIRLRNVSITFSGRERIHWSKSASTEAEKSERPLGTVITFRAKNMLIHTKKKLWKTSDGTDWEPINFLEIPFEIPLGETLPSDISLFHASISYTLQVNIERQASFFEFSKIKEKFPIHLTRYIPFSTLRMFSEPYEWVYNPLPPHPSEIDTYIPEGRHGGMAFSIHLSKSICGPSDILECDINLSQGFSQNPAKLLGVFFGIKMYKSYRGYHEITKKLTTHFSTEYIANSYTPATFDKNGLWKNNLSLQIPQNHECCTTFSEYITIRYKAKVKVFLSSTQPIKDLIRDKEILLVRTGAAQQDDMLREVNNVANALTTATRENDNEINSLTCSLVIPYEIFDPPSFVEATSQNRNSIYFDDSDREQGDENIFHNHENFTRAITLHEQLLQKLEGNPTETPPPYNP